MITNLTADDLIAFEEKVGQCFRNKEIRAPIHLYYGNEEKILKVFEDIKPEDWIFCSWRSHYQCLLKGVPEEQLLFDIKQGRSIALNYPGFKIYSSAIVTGILPAANGVAFDIKRRNLEGHVWCFLGDMTSETGCFHENHKYSMSHKLPITWVVEDNGKSVCTDTRATWNLQRLSCEFFVPPKMIHYKYETKYPHAGIGERIQF